MDFQNPEQGAPIECLSECPFFSSGRPIIRLEIEVIRLLRARGVIRPSETQDAQEEEEKGRPVHMTGRLKQGSIISCQSPTTSQVCFTLNWPGNHSCPSKQEHMFDLQREFSSSTLGLVSFSCVPTLSTYNISYSFFNLTTT